MQKCLLVTDQDSSCVNSGPMWKHKRQRSWAGIKKITGNCNHIENRRDKTKKQFTGKTVTTPTHLFQTMYFFLPGKDTLLLGREKKFSPLSLAMTWGGIKVNDWDMARLSCSLVPPHIIATCRQRDKCLPSVDHRKCMSAQCGSSDRGWSCSREQSSFCSWGSHRASIIGGFVGLGSRMTARRSSSHTLETCRALTQCGCTGGWWGWSWGRSPSLQLGQQKGLFSMWIHWCRRRMELVWNLFPFSGCL